jgi:hypothetical protein
MNTIKSITILRIGLICFYIYFASQPIAISQTDLSLPTNTIIAFILFCVVLLTHFPYTYITNQLQQNGIPSFSHTPYSASNKLIHPFLIIFTLILFVEHNIISGWRICVIIASIIILILEQFTIKNVLTTWIDKIAHYIQITGVILIYLYIILLSSINTISYIILNFFYDNVVYDAATIYSIGEKVTFPFATILINIIMVATVFSCINSIHKNLFTTTK